jgi:zinc protease
MNMIGRFRSAAAALCAAVLVLIPAAATAQTDPALFDEPLPDRDDVLMGELENGLRYIIKEHANPPGRLNMILHISSGSLNETERQRGMAHFLEHLAFNGSENFPPGETIKLFEKLGLTFGLHQNAFTTFDQTAYILQVPETSPELVQPGMLFLSDVLGRLLLLPEEVEKEREVVLEEYRRGRGPEARVFDELIERITPGSRLAARLPIGTPDHIRNYTAQDARDYWSRWYTTGNATLIVAGDMNPEAVVPYIQDAFGDIQGAPRPLDEDATVEPYNRSFPVVITDPELSETEFALYSIDEPGDPATTKGHFREELVDQVASWIFNRRLQQRVAEGAVDFRQGAAGSQDLFNAMRFASASVTGDLSDWRSMLSDLILEMKRAREFGFTERELEDARKALIAQTEQFARIESTLPGRVITQLMLQSVNADEPMLSAQQSADYMKELLPTLTVEEVSSRFSELHTPERAAVVLTAPEGDEVPSEEALMSAALEALAAEVEAERDEDRPTELMAEKPTPGAIAEMQLHPESAVFSAWFDNGVRFHHREMDYRKESVTATIAVTGGRIQETDDTRGLSEAAAVALRTPATNELSSIDIRDLLTGRNVSISGAAAQDHFAIVVSGSPEDLEEGMKVAHLLLTGAVLEGPAFEQWKQGVRQGIEGRKTQPQRYFAEVLRREWFPGADPRHELLEIEDLERLTRDAAQEWLTERLAEGAIEVSIVGDMPRARAAELAATYLGSLPARDRITPSTLASLRDIERRDGPVTVDETIESLAPTSFVFGGFYGADQSDVDDALKMSLAAQILRSRMVQELREERGLVYSIGASSQPAEAYPGFGRFFAASPVDPGKADQLAAAIHEMYKAFAKDGPTDEELETAKLQLANIMDETMKEPSFWTQRLSDMTYRGRSLSDVVEAPERLQTFSAREIRRAFAEHYDPDNRFTIVIRPEAPKSGAEDAG